MQDGSISIANAHEIACINSLAPRRPRCQFKTAIFNLVLLIGIFISSEDNALSWMPRDLTDDKSTLVQVMAWCRQATSHYLSQCWPSSMSPYGVTKPQWVDNGHQGDMSQFTCYHSPFHNPMQTPHSCHQEAESQHSSEHNHSSPHTYFAHEHGPENKITCLTLYVLNFSRGNINIYLHFVSLLHIDLTQVLKILPQVRPGHILHSQYHGYWCPGDVRSHDIDIVKPR